MEQVGTVKDVRPRRGRGPGVVVLDSGGTEVEASTFDPALLKTAALLMRRTVKFETQEKASKDGQRTFINLQTLEEIAPQDRPEAPGSIVEVEGIPTQQGGGELAIPGPQILVPAQTSIEQLEQSFALAVRQRELLEDFVKKRMKEGVHYMSGKVFGSEKPVLLQPGAQLILYCHGYTIDFEIIQGPPEGSLDYDEDYTIVTKAVIRNASGRVVGSAIGSAGSRIWSGRQGKLVPRAADPEKTMNTALKISQKRALVSACNNSTASSEFFQIDIDEPGYLSAEEPKARKKFIK